MNVSCDCQRVMVLVIVRYWWLQPPLATPYKGGEILRVLFAVDFSDDGFEGVQVVNG